jgi:hypothetical protein
VCNVQTVQSGQVREWDQWGVGPVGRGPKEPANIPAIKGQNLLIDDPLVQVKM